MELKLAIIRCGGNSFTDDRTVMSYTGLLIMGAPGTYHVLSFNGDASRFSNFLVPVLTQTTLQTENNGKTNYILQGDKFVRVPEEGVQLGPNAAYLAVPSYALVDNPIDEFTMEEVYEESGIKAISQNIQQGDWFTISGNKVPAPTLKGLYIHNNKKMVIR